MTDSTAAKATIEHVSKDLDAAKGQNDEISALEKFQQEFHLQLSKLNPEEQQKYVEDVVSGLTKNNKLPILALFYADQLGGNLNSSDLRMEIRAENRRFRDGDHRAVLAKSMLQYLSDNYDSLIHAHNGWWKEDEISKEDISAKLNQLRSQDAELKRQEKNRQTATESVKVILSGGDNSLFDFIDGQEKKNGKVTKDELKKYVDEARACDCSGGHFTREKLALVEKLIKDWDAPNSTRWLRGGYKGSTIHNSAAGRGATYVTDNVDNCLTKENLLAAAGKKSVAELLQGQESAKRNENSADGAKSVAVKPDTEGAQPETTSSNRPAGAPPGANGLVVQRNETSGTESTPSEIPSKVRDELAKLATARRNEGYSYIATRLLGFANPEANKKEIERAFASLSAADKQKVMRLSTALENANRYAHGGSLIEGDIIPLLTPEIKAMLKR